eukprot:SAG31_NODE_34441_length_333_cov_0.482906_1_plen_38_part_10
MYEQVTRLAEVAELFATSLIPDADRELHFAPIVQAAID